MTDPQTKQNPEILPQTISDEVSESDLGINKIKEDIAALKKDAQALEAKRADFEKNKNTLDKAASDQLKQEIDTEAKRIEAKKVALLTLLKQTKGELEALRGNVETTPERNQLDQLEKEIKEIQGEKKNIFEKVRERGKENPKTAIVATAGVGLLVRGIVSLFKRKKKTAEEGEGKKEKKGMSGRKKALLRGGGIFGGVMIWKNRDKIKDRFGDLFGTKNPDSPKDISYEDLTNVENMDKDFEKSPRMADYNVFGEKVNEFYTNMYGSGAMDGPDLLGEKDKAGKQLEKNAGTLPFILDEMYANVGDILSERSFFTEENLSTQGQITDYFMSKCPQFLGGILKPFVGTLAWLTEDMFNFDANGKLDLNQKGQDALEQNKGEVTENIFKGVFRKFIKIKVYLEDKEDQLRYIYTKKKLESLGEIKSGASPEEIDEFVDEKIHDDDFQEKNIDNLIKADFYDKKIISEMNKPGAFETLKDNNILDGKLGADVQKAVEDVDERKKGIVGDSLDTMLQGDQDLNTADNKKDLSEICLDMKEEIQSDFFKEAFVARKLGIFGNLFNLKGVAKEELLKMFGYQELTNSYIEQIGQFEKKLSGSITKQDVQDFKTTVDQFFMLEKEIMTGVGMMVDVKEENGSFRVRLQTVGGLIMNRFMNMGTGGKVALTLFTLGLMWKPTRKIIWKTTKFVGGIVLRPIVWAAGKSVEQMARSLRRGFGKSPIFREFNRYRFKGPQGTEELEFALRRGEITLDQATEIASRRTRGRWRSYEEKNLRKKIASSDREATRISLIKKTIDKMNIKTYSGEQRKLIAKHFDQKPWNKFFLTDDAQLRDDTLKLLESYTQKITDLKKANKVAHVEFLEMCIQRKGFNDFENIKKLVNNIETMDISKTTKPNMGKLARRLSRSISNLGDINAINDFLKAAPEIKAIDTTAINKVAFFLYEKRKINIDDLLKEFEPKGKYAKYPEFKSRYAAAKNDAKALQDLDTEFSTRLLRDGKSIEDILEYTADQKVVATLVSKDINELKKFINKDLRKQGYPKGSSLDLYYEKQVKQLEDFKYKIKGFAADELSAFSDLRKLEFKSHHIVELLELKKTNKAVEEAFEKTLNKTDDLKGLVAALKKEKAAGTEISETLIKTVEKMHLNAAIKSLDDVARVMGKIAKFFTYVAKVS